jgi:hypothetical protein
MQLTGGEIFLINQQNLVMRFGIKINDFYR